MRIFAASLATETNSFAPFPTGARAFAETVIHRGDAGLKGNGPGNLVAGAFRAEALHHGYELVEGLFASAQPSGRTVQSVYEGFRDEILGALEREGPFDVVLLLLHGAMASTDLDDCEGDLLERIRVKTGPKTVIGVELDPHCHLTRRMLANSDVTILMKEYPHIDYVERAGELFRLCTAAARGKHRPVTAVFDCRMVGFYPTTSEPMAGFLRRMREAECEPGILSVSFVHGFPWADVPEAGSKILVVADGDEGLARRRAESLGQDIYSLRQELLPRFPSIETALDLAERTEGLVVLADTADNSGGGAPGDNTALLRAMLAREASHAVFGGIWDPVVATICADAGLGARLPLRLGGKCGAASDDPLDVVATVKGIAEAHDQDGLGPARQPMGLSVWIDCEGIDVLVQSLRTQIFAPDAFSGIGIDLAGKRLVAVKSTQHFQNAFAPIANRIIHVATPGAIDMNFAALPYKKRDLNFFPRVPDPLRT